MRRFAILNFHGLEAPGAGSGRAPDPGEAPYWLSRDAFQRVLDLISQARVPVELTFDDGNASDLEIAAPILTERGLAAQCFMLSDRLGAPGSLSAEGLRALAAAGWGVGTHGTGHHDWRRLAPDALEREIAESRSRLGEAVGRPIEAAAIPFGGYGPGVLRTLRRTDLARVYSSDGGLARPGTWPTPRITLRADSDLGALAAILAKREPELRRARRALAMRVKRGIVPS